MSGFGVCIVRTIHCSILGRQRKEVKGIGSNNMERRNPFAITDVCAAFSPCPCDMYTDMGEVADLETDRPDLLGSFVSHLLAEDITLL